MRIQKTLSTVIVFIIGVVAVPSAFSSNIGRNVYGIYTETYNGAKYDMPATDADSIHLYIWNGNFIGSDRIDTPIPEGSKYLRITVNSTNGGWDGLGYTPINTGAYKDMSSYYNGYLKFYARTSNSAVTGYDCGIKVGSTIEVWLDLGAYGLVADGNWHEISIPLNTTTNSSLTAVNLANVSQMFMLRNGASTLTVGHAIDIDNIVWVKSGTGSFTPSLKRISDDVAVQQ